MGFHQSHRKIYRESNEMVDVMVYKKNRKRRNNKNEIEIYLSDKGYVLSWLLFREDEKGGKE